MLDGLLPPDAHVAERDVPGGPADLLPVEAGAVEAAIPRRRAELAAGRACARTALADLGHPPVAIPVGDRRQPVWPHGVVGSITHCGHYAAAAVATADRVAALGIDVDENRPLPHGAASLTTRPDEHTALPHRPDVDWGAALLCAREALFKAWWPRCATWLDPLDVTIDLRPDTGSFGVVYTAPDAAATAQRTGMGAVEGRFAWDGAHVAAAAWLPADRGI